MISDPVQTLGLPERALVGERLTKKLLLDMAAETASDRKLITNAISSATVEAVLTPATTGIAEHREPGRRVQDVAVISLVLAGQVSAKDEARLFDLLHRSMPRPVIILLKAPDDGVTISAALTRVSQTDDSRSVVEASIAGDLASLPEGSLDIGQLVRTDLWAYYQDLAKAIATDGNGSPDLDAAHAIAERHRLDGLEADLATVARQAQKERSLPKRIDLNTRAKTLRAEIEDVRGLLYAHRQQQHH
ncbi:DUF4391 domain-containing protein [Cellulosimicrobium cellulans]|uniref:DUF4391 domain-containing protein n=1 Tax=Cellulosimicrobium cellulans TaxID=1710 RepID=UPI0020CFC3A2|nr:DUF4391 domain-containing protein [Cellulosimicrobium cellulans]